MKVNEEVLREELASHDFELISVTPGRQRDTVAVEANTLHAVPMDQPEPVYIPVRVALLVTLDSHSRIRKIEDGIPDPKAVADSEKFVRTLLDNKQISGLPGSSKPNPTHQIERNKKGQQVIKRRNFSAY